MSEKIERCEVKLVSDQALGWKLKLSGECSETLRQIDSLPPRRKEYIKRRVEV